MIKSFLAFISVVACCVASPHAKMGAMLSIENIEGVESVRPLDSLWCCVVVDISEGRNVDTNYIIGVFKISGFESVRFLLPNEVVNIAIVE